MQRAHHELTRADRERTLAGFAFMVLFFLSGFAALLYQVVWQRMLTFFGGADIFSVTIIVSAFMGGLGFGSLLGGHLADRLDNRQRLITFALCELAVAVFAVFSAGIYYDLLYMRWGNWAPSRLVMASVIFAVTLWPTIFMGMSLPLLARLLAADSRQPYRWVQLLYGANTVGAACGSAFAAAVLFRNFDFAASVQIGASISFICAVTAVLAFRPLSRGQRLDSDANRKPPQAMVEAGPAEGSNLIAFRTWLSIYALSGFVALSLEIVWLRVLGVILKSNSFTFGHLLAVYLSGVGVGALAANHSRLRSTRPVAAFLVLQSAIPVVAASSLALFVLAVDRITWAEPVWQYLGQYEPLSREALIGSGSGPATEPARRGLLVALYGVVPLALMGPATCMMGLSFGYLQRAVQTDLETLGRRVGWLQTANIIGSMAGALLTGLVLLDWFGTAGTLRLLVCCSLVFLVLLARTRRASVSHGGFVAAVSGVCLLAFALPSATTLWARLHRAQPEQIIQSEDGSGLSVLKNVGGHQTFVYANGLGQSTLPYGGIHSVLGSLPAMVHPRPISVAVIGLGSGDTLFAIGGRPETTTIDSIEIIAPEYETLRLLDQRQWYGGLRGLLRDGRVHHLTGDGRAYIRKGGRHYDIIEADALRPTSAYAGNLFSVEYFELVRDALTRGGFAVTWTPTPRVVDTLTKVFAHVVLFDDLAIGSMSPIAFDRATIKARMDHAFTREYYRAGGIDLDKVLAPYLNAEPKEYGPQYDRTALVDVNRDLFPKDEFAIPYTGADRQR